MMPSRLRVLGTAGVLLSLAIASAGASNQQNPPRGWWRTESIVKDPSRRTVILGDINEWFFLAHTLRHLGAHFGRSSTVRTWPSWWPLAALDRIWVHPPETLTRVWAHTSPTARQASDHLPLVGLLVVGG